MNDTQDAAPEDKSRDSSKAVSIPRERQDPDEVWENALLATSKRLAEEHKRKEQLPKK